MPTANRLNAMNALVGWEENAKWMWNWYSCHNFTLKETPQPLSPAISFRVLLMYANILKSVTRNWEMNIWIVINRESGNLIGNRYTWMVHGMNGGRKKKRRMHPFKYQPNSMGITQQINQAISWNRFNGLCFCVCRVFFGRCPSTNNKKGTLARFLLKTKLIWRIW